MVNYNNGKIYKLCCKDINVKEIYVGSTCNELKVRKYQHKSHCNNDKSKKYNINVYKFIRENGGFENWDIVIIEKYKECNDKLELHQRERYYLELLGATLNSQIPNRSQKEWHEDNKEHKKQYREYNKDKIKEKDKDYYQKNKEHKKEYYKEYNKEKVKCNICNKEMTKNSLTRHKRTIHK